MFGFRYIWTAMVYGMVDLFTVLISDESKVDGPYIINEYIP